MMPNSNVEYLPHVDLFNSWDFIKIQKTGKVLGIKNIVVKVYQILDATGKTALNPDGTEMLSVMGTNVIRDFTYEEYLKIMKEQGATIEK